MAIIIASINVYYQHAITTPTVKWPRNNNKQAIVYNRGRRKILCPVCFFNCKIMRKKCIKKCFECYMCTHVGEKCFFQFFPNSQSNKFLSIVRPFFLIGYCFNINRNKPAWPTTLDKTCWDMLQKYLLFLSSFLVFSCVKTCIC